MTATTIDGLAGDEGVFLACSFWMADDMTVISRIDGGRPLFEELLSLRNDVGFIGEERNSVPQCQVGNFPQASLTFPLR